MNKREFQAKMKKTKLLIQDGRKNNTYGFAMFSCNALSEAFKHGGTPRGFMYLDKPHLVSAYKALFTDSGNARWLERDLLKGEEYDDIDNLRIDMLSLLEEITLMNKNYLEW